MISPVLEVDSFSLIIGMDEVERKLEMKVQPNPFSDKLIVSIGEQDLRHWLEVYSMNGKRVFSEQLVGNSDSEFDLGFLSNGSYNLIVRNEFGRLRSSFKIVKSD
jgi:hypothetical protein